MQFVMEKKLGGEACQAGCLSECWGVRMSSSAGAVFTDKATDSSKISQLAR